MDPEYFRSKALEREVTFVEFFCFCWRCACVILLASICAILISMIADFHTNIPSHSVHIHMHSDTHTNVYAQQESVINQNVQETEIRLIWMCVNVCCILV